MLCDECGKREATFHFVNKINGIKTERHLCALCQNKVSGGGFLDPDVFFPSGIGGLLEGLFGDRPRTRQEQVCPSCGTTDREFLQNGFLGCPRCYKAFGPTVLSAVRRMQGDVSHVGKVPYSSEKDAHIEYDRLQKEKAGALEAEEYEKAEIIQERLNQLKGM